MRLNRYRGVRFLAFGLVELLPLRSDHLRLPHPIASKTSTKASALRSSFSGRTVLVVHFLSRARSSSTGYQRRFAETELILSIPSIRRQDKLRHRPQALEMGEPVVPQPLNPSTPQPLNPSTPQPPQPLNPSTPQPLNPSTPQPLNPSTPQPLNPSTPQPLNPSTPQPLNPSTPQPLNPSIDFTSLWTLRLPCGPISILSIVSLSFSAPLRFES